jgi:protocatechuate 3,4-dioxygenase beta subunit
MLNRRQMIRHTAFTAAAMTTPGLFAEELSRTARQTEGPFYPNKLPLDTDNDLLIVNDALTPAVGKVTHLSTTTAFTFTRKLPAVKSWTETSRASAGS